MGCARQSTLIVASDSFVIRLIAPSSASDALLIAASESQGSLVSIDVEVVAQWIPFPESLAKTPGDLNELVVRRSQRSSELLVLHAADDTTDQAVQFVDGVVDRSSNERTLFTLTEEGSKKMFALTVQHFGQRVALIVNDELRAVPAIVSPVRTQMIMTPEKIDKVRAHSLP